MRIKDIESMSFEDLWLLHEELTKLLVEKMAAEKSELEKRLALLSRTGDLATNPLQISGALADAGGGASPTGYPKIPPKFRNTSPPYEVWSGRGKQPRWLKKALDAGGNLEDFRIVVSTDADGPRK
jgi:DNA-binding protein H-NS